MRITALKPCTFGGKKFLIGDEIHESLVANPKVQAKMGTIAISGNGGTIQPQELQQYTSQVGEVKFEIIIHSEGGDLPLAVNNEELSIFTDILQINVSKTEDKQKVSDIIQKIESEDLLIILDALDGRKFVKDEAQERAKILSESFEDDTQEDGGNPEPDTDSGGDE